MSKETPEKTPAPATQDSVPATQDSAPATESSTPATQDSVPVPDKGGWIDGESAQPRPSRTGIDIGQGGTAPSVPRRSSK